MKNLSILLSGFLLMLMISCVENHRPANTTALDEQSHTETNQQRLNASQPLPDITWSMERDNLIKLKKLQNDRTINFFMYVFIEGISEPIGYYQVNKVSSVNSQLSNPEQIISGQSASNNLPNSAAVVISSPSEDGSYGTNGDAVFGFTPEDIYIQTNCHYVCSSVPLNFNKPVNKLVLINTEESKKILERSIAVMKK